jgi:hypothetical protein
MLAPFEGKTDDHQPRRSLRGASTTGAIDRGETAEGYR